MFSQNALLSEMVRLKKFAIRLTRNKADAEDLLQSTCLRALEKKEYFESGTNLFSWTSRIMFNLFVSGYRRRVKFETKFSPDIHLEKASIAPSQESEVEFAEIMTAIDKLNPAHREVLIMVCIKGLQYEEASTMLHIPLGTVRSRLSRARKQLQIIMKNPEIQQDILRTVSLRQPHNENVTATSKRKSPRNHGAKRTA